MLTKMKNWILDRRYARAFEKFTMIKIKVLRRSVMGAPKMCQTAIRWTSLVDRKLRDRFVQRMRKRGFTVKVDDDLVAGFIAISWGEEK